MSPTGSKSRAAPPEVHPMRMDEVWKAGTTWDEAFQRDPLVNYIRGRKQTYLRRAALKMTCRIIILLWRHNEYILSVEGGTSIIVAHLLQALGQGWKGKDREAEEKMNKAAEEVLGDRVKEMVYVGLLATSPKSQGHGYGSALLEEVTRIADYYGQATWLKSSNIRNTDFYNSHGFLTVATATIGDEDPDWQEWPVIVSIMVRQPAGRPECQSK
ncbi:hypothetical protein D9613_005109 [Agrocybe pediades]|uniref:N-acetyltransferase domain-containing protein n=1 Tax=Agrocybe pediades TaxID=84607 RepID=A0A8H4QY40_9AGAR|nr:hypothetical protein D9613_005109 [Agrocybe pediades]